MKTIGNAFGAACYDQNTIEELKECIENYNFLGSIAANKSDCKEWGITPKEWINQIKAALYDKITDLVEESKDNAIKNGSTEIASGVWLMTGKNAIEETADYRSEMDTDKVAEGYSVDDIQGDELYIQADNGYFAVADDDDIQEIIENNL